MRPLVSIITATYNSRRFLADYLDSLKSQTHDNWEAILVDDGSTDETVHLAEKAALGDPRVRIIRKAPEGNPAIARMIGVAHAKGEWIAFLDHDDIWHPQKLALQLKAMVSMPEALLCHTGRFVFNTKVPNSAPFEEIRAAKAICQPVSDLLEGNFITFSSSLIRRDLLVSLGGLDQSKELRGVDDYDLWLRLAPSGTLAFLPEPLTGWRNHGVNLGHDRLRMAEGLKAIATRLETRGAPSVYVKALRFQALKSFGVTLIKDEPLAALKVLSQAATISKRPKLLAITAFALLAAALPSALRVRILNFVHRR